MVGISLLTLVPGVVGGSEIYVRELLPRLVIPHRVFLPSIVRDLDGEVVRSYPASGSMPGRMRAMAQAALAPWPIRNEMRLEELDVIHFPLTVMLPRVRRPPAVTSILDLQHEFFPDYFPRAELAYRKLVYRWTARASERVIAISEHAKRTLVERLGVRPERVRVIYFGVDHERFRPGPEEREPFLLYPANRWPHKNHERLFEAFALLRRERPGLRLVLTGAGHTSAPDGVELAGHVSRDELARLYRTAAALVFPSLYEGFGMPPLEAMASGLPVAGSNAASLPEVVGDAGALFDPHDPEAIAAAVRTVLDDPAPWVERGLARAAEFSWEACAREHEAVYRELGAS
jgi:glycosyltransferase involved in cell wall biosynthesis